MRGQNGGLKERHLSRAMGSTNYVGTVMFIDKPANIYFQVGLDWPNC
jgi:hypothetical protein